MFRSHLSIFSSKTLDTKSFPKSFWLSVIVFFVCLVVIETASRILMGPIGQFSWAYWSPEAINKFEWYREISQKEKTPDILVIGDSTGARNFDPGAFSMVAGKTSYNLAWPANFPKALRATTYPLLEKGRPPETVILIQNPRGYTDSQRAIRFENSILSSQIAKQYSKNYLVSDYIYISRVYSARFLLVKYWVHHEAIVSEPDFLGFMPAIKGGKKTLEARIERQDETPVGSLSPERLNCFSQLAVILNQRNIQLIVVIPPVNADDVPPIFGDYIDWLKAQSQTLKFSLWDFSHADFLTDDHFFDKGHLNSSGAGLFSSELGKRYKNGSYIH